MSKFAFVGLAVIGLLAAVPAAAWGPGQSNGEAFVDAVSKEDITKALQLLREHPTVLNARDAKGETGLLIAVRRGDREWTGFLINSGADANLAGPNGETPIIAAAKVGFEDAIKWMAKDGVKIDSANKLGETALILAVQMRNAKVTRTLLDAGANPDKTDYAGYSARDYAARDTRSRQMAELIEAKKPKK